MRVFKPRPTSFAHWHSTYKPQRDPSSHRPKRATLCHAMDVSVRELRNHTARVIAAVESGELVVLTVHGRPVADIVPRRLRSERRPSDLLLADLAEIGQLAAELEVVSDAGDFDVELTTDDMLA
jgi:prevent-host-death family protein